MTKLGAAFENTSRLAFTAAEEAQRFGHPLVDMEHMFLALLVSQTEAGQRLRAAGIELIAARQAVQDEHGHRLAALGIRDAQVAPRPLSARGPSHIDWNERTRELVTRTGGDSQLLLHSLIDDAGGFVSAVLSRVGSDPSEVVATATGAGRVAVERDHTGSTGRPETVTHDAFIPAPRQQVWGLLDDPRRRSEWDALVADMEPVGPGQWIGHCADEQGGSWRIPKRARTRSIILVEREESRLLEWDITFPDVRNGKHDRLRVELSDESSGTSLHLMLRDTRFRRPGRLRRFLAGIELASIAAGISRPFRA